MNQERWQQVWDIFESTLRQTPETRRAFVDRACGVDEKLRRAVFEMLAADGETGFFLDQPLVRVSGADDPTSEDRSGALPAGTVIGPYRLGRCIGEGGMGTVYLAARADDAFQRRMVIKLVRQGLESEAFLERLRTERQILAGLDHPCIARLYDGGSIDDGSPYFVLEYVDGLPIDLYCQENQLSIDERLSLFRKVCEAVHYAHQNLVVHCDLKPSNILVLPDGSPKLVDFGIAKLLNPEIAIPARPSTASSQRLLTPNFASREQILGQQITTASDVYSLGVLLYKLLTDRLPYQLSGRPQHEIRKILTESELLAPSIAVTRSPITEKHAEAIEVTAGSRGLPPIPKLRRQLAGDLDAIILKALHSAPLRRYSSAGQLASDLERYQSGRPVTARVGGWRYRVGKFVRRNRGAVMAAVASVVLVLGFAMAMAFLARHVTFERDQARRERDGKTQVVELVRELFRLSNPYYAASGGELTVVQALERSVPVLLAGLPEQPDVRADLLHTSGSILTVFGLYDEAHIQLSEALEIRRRLHGDQHSEVVASLHALAAVEKEQGNLDRAEELARRAVATASELVGEHHPDLAAPLNELVSILCYRSEYDAAEQPAEELLRLVDDLPVSWDQRITAREHLARIRSAQGDYPEAVRLNREGVALRRKRYGESHPTLIPTLSNLGRNLRRSSHLDAAVRTYEEALSLQRTHFGEDDPILLNNLAGVYYAQGKMADAESLYHQARQAQVDDAGPEHWLVYVFELRIARTRIYQGEPAAAESELRRLLKRWQPLLGEHWRIAEGQGFLGESLSVQGRCFEAEPLLVKSFEQLLEKSSQSAREDGFERLRQHLERCDKEEQVSHFAAQLAAASG